MLAWNDERTRRWVVNATSTQSPAATCSTSGSGLNLIGDAGVPVTNAPAGALTPPETLTSTAETVICFTGALAGHGLPASVGASAGGRPPVCVGIDAAAGGVVPGSACR